MKKSEGKSEQLQRDFIPIIDLEDYIQSHY